MELKIQNSKIDGTLLLAFLTFIDLVVITTVDIYVPALPLIRDEFNVTEAYLNNTMMVFLIASSISVLIVSPLSDKFGRKKMINLACISFIVGSFFCMISPNVDVLILSRIFQAFGMGSVMTCATSMVQESFSKKSINLAVTLIQSLILVGPLLAPFIGTAILSISTWRSIFLLLLILGIFSFILSLFLPETKPLSINKNHVNALFLFKKKSFISVIVILCLSGLPYYALIGVFSYICLEFFNMSYFDYNILYALACFVSILSPFLFQQLSKYVSRKSIFTISLILMTLSIIGLIIFGFNGAYIFLLMFLPYVVSEGMIRPLSFVILLDQPKEYVSIASSLTNFSYSIVTSFGSAIAMLPIFPNYIAAIIWMIIATLIISSISLVIYSANNK